MFGGLKNGGGDGNRTRVRKIFYRVRYRLSSLTIQRHREANDEVVPKIWSVP